LVVPDRLVIPSELVLYHAVVPVHEELPDVAFQVKVSPLLCPKTCPTTPSITANNPTHFPSLKTGEAIFQTGRRGRRFGILDVGCWMLE
jgi:hypothetical protein